MDNQSLPFSLLLLLRRLSTWRLVGCFYLETLMNCVFVVWLGYFVEHVHVLVCISLVFLRKANNYKVTENWLSVPKPRSSHP